MRTFDYRYPPLHAATGQSATKWHDKRRNSTIQLKPMLDQAANQLIGDMLEF